MRRGRTTPQIEIDPRFHTTSVASRLFTEVAVDPEQMAGPLRSNEGLGVIVRRLGNAKQQFRHLLGNRDHCVVSG